MLVSRAKSRRCRGSITLWVLFALGLFISIFALLWDVSLLWRAREELRISADAAGLAAGGMLVDDDMLLGDPKRTAAILARARAEAFAYGRANPVHGLPLELKANEENEPGGDIEFGYLEVPDPGQFANVPGDQLFPRHHSLLPPVNAVRVHAHRTRARGNPGGMRLGRILNMESADVSARATVYLDRDVIGFRLNHAKALPFVPLALWSDRGVVSGWSAGEFDPFNPKPAARSWELQTVLPLVEPGLPIGRDEWHFDPVARQFQPVQPGLGILPDGLPEMAVLIPVGPAAGPGAPAWANGRMVLLGREVDWPTFLRQVESGLTVEDLASFSGALKLVGDERTRPGLAVPSLPAVPAGDPEMEALLAVLLRLAASGEPRIWPLYDRSEAHESGEGVAHLSGFVAARLARAEVVRLPVDPSKPDAGSKPCLRLVLQPSSLSVPEAITDFRARLAHPDLQNPYLAKVKLVQ